MCGEKKSMKTSFINWIDVMKKEKKFVEVHIQNSGYCQRMQHKITEEEHFTSPQGSLLVLLCCHWIH